MIGAATLDGFVLAVVQFSLSDPAPSQRLVWLLIVVGIPICGYIAYLTLGFLLVAFRRMAAYPRIKARAIRSEARSAALTATLATMLGVDAILAARVVIDSGELRLRFAGQPEHPVNEGDGFVLIDRVTDEVIGAATAREVDNGTVTAVIGWLEPVAQGWFIQEKGQPAASLPDGIVLISDAIVKETLSTAVSKYAEDS